MTTKSEIVDAVSASTGQTKQATKQTVDAVFAHITSCLVNGEKVHISGLGAFSVKETAARTGRNPATGATVDIPAGRKIVFKPSADVKASL